MVNPLTNPNQTLPWGVSGIFVFLLMHFGGSFLLPFQQFLAQKMREMNEGIGLRSVKPNRTPENGLTKSPANTPTQVMKGRQMLPSMVPQKVLQILPHKE